MIAKQNLIPPDDKLPEIKFTIKKNDTVIVSHSQTTNFQDLAEALNKFAVELNASVGQILENEGELNADDVLSSDESEESDDQEQDEQLSPKKKKRN